MRLLRNTLVVLALVLPGVAAAQLANQEPVRYVVSPETPGPNQPVTIVAEGVGSFLGDAAITWRHDGAVVKQGAGERSYTFMTGSLGSRTTISVTINSATNGTFSHTFTFSPSVVTLLWEADTTVPPLFRGKALYSAGSDLKVVAFPTIFNGATQVNPSSLSYQWHHNDEPAPASSGLGRTTFSFTGDQLRVGEMVAVDVYLGSAKIGRGEITIPTTEPRVLLYQYNALQGTLYDAALPPSIALTAQELTVRAEPYYFANESKRTNALQYEWTLNSDGITGPDSARGILTLRQAGTGSGQATLRASLQNFDSSKFVQTAETAVTLVFGESGSSAISSFFGL